MVSDTYSVTISRVRNFRGLGDYWVAHDERGDWRSYCSEESADNAPTAALMMFHEDTELVSVEDCGETAIAIIRV